MFDDILFKNVFLNKNTYVSNCRYWWKISRYLEKELSVRNTWIRKYTAFTEVMPMFEFHCGNKRVIINQYNPLDIQGEFDERKYITAYFQDFQLENATTQCFVIWLVITQRNVKTAVDLIRLYLMSDSSMQERLQNIYSFHEICHN